MLLSRFQNTVFLFCFVQVLFLMSVFYVRELYSFLKMTVMTVSALGKVIFYHFISPPQDHNICTDGFIRLSCSKKTLLPKMLVFQKLFCQENILLLSVTDYNLLQVLCINES